MSFLFQTDVPCVYKQSELMSKYRYGKCLKTNDEEVEKGVEEINTWAVPS